MISTIFSVCVISSLFLPQKILLRIAFISFSSFFLAALLHTHTARAKNDQKQFGDCFVQMENVGLQKYGYNIAIARL